MHISSIKWSFRINIFFLSLLLISFSTQANECLVARTSQFEAENLAEEVLNLTSSVATTKVLDLTVTKFGRQGSGQVYVVTDEDGNIAGVRVNFKLKNEKKSSVMLKTFDELKKGDSLRYKENDKYPALVVRKNYNKDISKEGGGEFLFSILTEKPHTYKHYKIYLRKVSGTWKARNANSKILKSVDLNPNLSGLEWDGTFSEAYLE